MSKYSEQEHFPINEISSWSEWEVFRMSNFDPPEDWPEPGVVLKVEDIDGNELDEIVPDSLIDPEIETAVGEIDDVVTQIETKMLDILDKDKSRDRAIKRVKKMVENLDDEKVEVDKDALVEDFDELVG